jgi:predicted nicotinamide N-methyase
MSAFQVDADLQCLRLHNTFSPELMPLAVLFLQMAPVASIMEKIVNIPDWPTENGQQRLYFSLVKLYSFPLSLKYVKYLNKQITREVENSGHYWQEELADLILGYSPDSSVHMDDDCYAGFLLPKSSGSGSDVICCGVQRAHNLVGMRTWGAGMLWCEIFYNSGDVFKGMSVLELGSGVGMSGLVAARSPAPPASVVMTDFTDKVLENLQRNIDLDLETGGERNTFVGSCKLDWNDVVKGTWVDSMSVSSSGSGSEIEKQRCVAATTSFDLLLAADCTYSEDIATALLRTIEVFLTRNPKDSSCALVASCIRSLDTWMHFVRGVHASTVVDYYHVSDWGHKMGAMSPEAAASRAEFYCEDRKRIRMYCLVLKGRPLPCWITANATDGSETYLETAV